MNTECTQKKSKEFEILLRNRNTDLNTFIELFNKWSKMNTEERGECIDKLVW